MVPLSKNWNSVMRLKIEFAICLALSAIYWLLLFPLLGATSTAPSAMVLAGVIAGYAAICTMELQLFYGAQIALGARFSKFKQTMIFVALIASQLLPQYVVFSLLSLVVPGLVTSYAWFALAVACGFIGNYAALVSSGEIRERVELIEMRRRVTLIVRTHGAYLPVLKGTELDYGEPLLIAREDLADKEECLGMAWTAMNQRDWETADRYLLIAIPQLKECGMLGILRVTAACIVMKQSHAALGNTKEVEEYDRRLKYLSQLYATSGGA